MTSSVAERLEALAERDAVVAPLARLYAAALRLSSAVPPPELVAPLVEPRSRSTGSAPVLEGQTLAVAVGYLAGLLSECGGLLGASGLGASEELAEAIAAQRLPVLDLLRAGIRADGARFAELATQAGVSPASLATLGQVLAVPVLAACRQQLPHGTSGWSAGYCPVCAAWPVLAEFRGLERERWLRCGRCGASWRYPHQQCPFCGTDDHRRLRYLAEEGKQDAQRIEVCLACRGYLKTFATLGPWSHGELLLQDLGTVELDLAALERDYRRPEGLGHPLSLEIVAKELAA